MIDDISKIQDYLKKENIDAYIIFSSDPHCSEYMADRYRIIRYFSSFSGSAGTLLIAKDKSYLWTDGRYFIQAATELKSTNTILMKMGEPNVPTIFEFIKGYQKIALDFETTALENINEIKKINSKINLIDNGDIINKIWKDRPSIPSSKAFMLEENDAGESISSKINKIKKYIKSKSILISDLNDIAWTFNLRGFDIKYNMVNYAYAIISQNTSTLYINDNKLDNHIIETLNACNVAIKPYSCIYNDLILIDSTIIIDPYNTNYKAINCIKKSKLIHPSIVENLKSTKNKTEILNIKRAHIIDAVAMIKFIKYVKDNAINLNMDELSLSDKLLSIRSENTSFIMPSFATICAFNSNGAIVHYEANKFTNKTISENGLLLIDSGGQYKYATTDITRTLAIGNISKEMKHDFTLVLKSHIALALSIFNPNTTGDVLDQIARGPMKIEQKDFKHGTGHGVGYMLSVHEGPQSISPRAKFVPFVKNMITSNEPGYYLENQYGIRHENLTLTKQSKGKLHFETLTLVPFDVDAIDVSMLNNEEKEWINKYHSSIYKKISPYLDEETKTYLKGITKKIG